MNNLITFPDSTEYPSYAEMYMNYVKRDGTLIRQFEDNLESTKKFISELRKESLDVKYRPDKWTLKEVLVHIIDDERIYAYRALCFARNDKTCFPGFEETEYAKHSDAHLRSLNSIIEEYVAVRKATITLFKGFSERALLRIGRANENNTSVRALGYHIVGHELHHIQIIRDRYLSQFT
ncbi:DinB family protein [Aquimarina sp. AD10]|uniref:DNA damage-inducible protein DinB n=1 Tax=Aquimarina aggregata TaxID=1642818 RepID=A0A162WY93_9FLAO|nr:MULTISPECIES: DinB family protein [Aquimarina]AXT60611.1 DinB family protein [Aquimarina sp. AD10]KZS38329.1 DNA damage-inducible protein DinB [Aquimarina aggregata]RKN01704.1 DinB family protein [Aquimarina sp. AD10]